MYWLKVVLIFLKKKIFEIGKAIGIGILYTVGAIVVVGLIFALLFGLGWVVTRIIILMPLKDMTFNSMMDFYGIHGAVCALVILLLTGIGLIAKSFILWIHKNWQEAKLEAKK